MLQIPHDSGQEDSISPTVVSCVHFPAIIDSRQSSLVSLQPVGVKTLYLIKITSVLEVRKTML